MYAARLAIKAAVGYALQNIGLKRKPAPDGPNDIDSEDSAMGAMILAADVAGNCKGRDDPATDLIPLAGTLRAIVDLLGGGDQEREQALDLLGAVATQVGLA